MTAPSTDTGLPGLTEAHFEQISTLVKNLSGINLHTGKKELVKARLRKRLRELGLAGFGEYIDHLANDGSGDEIALMLDTLSTNVTRFFREADHFEFLGSRVLPRVLQKAEKKGRRLRFWSAGCSSGEEPYSIAIQVCECLGDLRGWDVKILATDISARMITRARGAVYDQERLRDMPGALVNRYFLRTGDPSQRLYRVRPAVRSLVHFARHNLMGSWPMRGPFNVIFCRNVMIYFDKPTREELVERFGRLLVPGGVLFIGHSESLAGIRHRFDYLQPTVYSRKR